MKLKLRKSFTVLILVPHFCLIITIQLEPRIGSKFLFLLVQKIQFYAINAFMYQQSKAVLRGVTISLAPSLYFCLPSCLICFVVPHSESKLKQQQSLCQKTPELVLREECYKVLFSVVQMRTFDYNYVSIALTSANKFSNTLWALRERRHT